MLSKKKTSKCILSKAKNDKQKKADIKSAFFVIQLIISNPT